MIDFNVHRGHCKSFGLNIEDLLGNYYLQGAEQI